MTAVKTTPETLLKGLAVDAGGKAQCDQCHEPVREGDRVGVYAYQMVEWAEPAWDLPTVACIGCRRSDLETSTLGAVEVLAHARLGVTSDSATQSARLTIRDPDIVLVSPADNGSEP